MIALTHRIHLEARKGSQLRSRTKPINSEEVPFQNDILQERHIYLVASFFLASKGVRSRLHFAHPAEDESYLVSCHILKAVRDAVFGCK